VVPASCRPRFGFVLTNAHVVSGLEAIKAALTGLPEVSARVSVRTPCDDVAADAARESTEQLKALPLASSKRLSSGRDPVTRGLPVRARELVRQRDTAT